MSTLKLQIQTGRVVNYLDQNFETAGGQHAIAQRIVDFINRVQTGNEVGPVGAAPSIAISIKDNETSASGKHTFTSVVATNTFSINGVTFTAVQVELPETNLMWVERTTITATNAAAAINASVTSLIPGYVTAKSALTVVTVTSAFTGLAGNQAALVGSN